MPGIPHDLVRILSSNRDKSAWEIDLGGLRFIDSAGIVFLFHLIQALEEKGKSCSLIRAGGDVARMFKVTGARAFL